MRVDDALRATEHFLDRALLEGRDVIYLLHGHGSGALRAALRAALQRSRAVERYSAAAPDQGGDALTVVRLR
ncbi:MAG: Smr/MutS family protein [Proteobacteria bacterium]|nr:Smr/MutS family protein [Pseudomonadota bacterium]